MTSSPVAPVEIAGSDGAILRGQLWPGSTSWVVLLHEPGDDMDLDLWLPLAPHLAAREWSVLAVDLRGHGASDGEWDPALATADLTAMVAFARGEGATFVAIAGARESVVTALRSAPAARPDAMVLLSPALGPEDDPMALRGAGEAKLVAVGSLEPGAQAAAERLRKALIGWGMLISLPTTEQGTAMLSGALAGQLREHIIGFLAEQRFLKGKKEGRPRAVTQESAEPDADANGGTEQRRHE